MQPQDIQSRETATDITRSFAVAAPAGSGKTGLLTLRVLKLLARVTKPEEILCITFTNKAAQEMRERIVGALKEAKAYTREEIDALLDQHKQNILRLAKQVLHNDLKNDWQLLEAPGRLRIMTIDGFCRSIVKQLPLLSQMGLDTDILNAPEQTYEEAAEQYITKRSSDSENQDFLRLLSHLNGNFNRLKGLLVGLLHNRDQWLPIIFQMRHDQAKARIAMEAALHDWESQIILSVASELIPYETELCDLANYCADNIKALEPNSPILSLADYAEFPHTNETDISKDIIGFWQPLAYLLTTGTGGIRKSFTKKIGFPAMKDSPDPEKASQLKTVITEVQDLIHARPELLESLNILKILPPPKYSDEQWLIIESLLHELPQLVAHLHVMFSQHNATDFTEITQKALQALSGDNEHSDVALKLDYRIRHILIDEFQDTSYPQLELLKRLIKEWQPDEDRTLFLVGDGMQSCYGFRNANVGIFLGIRLHGLENIDISPLDLTVNFRSRPEIIEWVNQVFQGGFPAENNLSRGAVKYARSHAFQQPDPTNAYAKCIGFDSDSDDDEQTAYIIERIQYYRNHYPNQTIAVLGKSRSHLKPIIHQAKLNQIPFQAIDLDLIADKQIIVDLMSLTRAFLNESDRAAWIALLRSPWCGLSWQAIYWLLHSSPDDPTVNRATLPVLQTLKSFDGHSKLSGIEIQLVKRFYRTLAKAYANRRRTSLQQTLQTLWFQLGGATGIELKSDIDDIQSFFTILAEHEQAGTILDWPEFESRVNQIFASSQVSETNPVQFMTMHKSKGLEFDTVFLPNLHKTSRSDNSELMTWQEYMYQSGPEAGDICPIVSPIAQASDTAADPLSELIRLESSAKNQLESLRLLYVACTRAKQRLYLTANFKMAEDTPKPPAKNTLLFPIWQTLKDQFDITLSSLPSSTTQEKTTPWQTRAIHLPFDWTASVSSPSITVDGNSQTKTPDVSLLLKDDHSSRYAQMRGTFVHQVFMYIVKDERTLGMSQKFDLNIKFWHAELRRLGIQDSATRETLIEEVHQLLKQLSVSTVATWVLQPKHRDSQCELPIYGRDSGLHIIDRTFIDKDVRWVIDYKTSTPSLDQSVDNFLAAEAHAYTEQLLAYQQLFERSETHPVKCALYFPFIDQLYQFPVN